MSDGGWVHDDEDIVDGKYCAFLLHFCANVIVALICLTLQASMHLDIFISNYGKKNKALYRYSLVCLLIILHFLPPFPS
jgi:hypothetical protein